MNISFSVIKTREILEKQFQNLLKKAMNSWQMPKRFFIILFVASVIYLALYFFTQTSYVEDLKGVIAFLLLNCWRLLFLLFVFMWLRNIRNNWRLKKFLNTISLYQLSYTVEINDEHVRMISEQNIIEYPWDVFIKYGIYNDTLYVFNKTKAMNSLYWDRDEMGSDNYLLLIDFLKQKNIVQAFHVS